MKKIIFILSVFGMMTPVMAIVPDMGRTTQTLNQIDKSQDGVISRNQGYHQEVDKPSLNKSYNDDAHRDYVRRQKQKKREKKNF